MDKNAIKKFAIRARNKLLGQVEQKALQYGISTEGVHAPQLQGKDAVVINGAVYNEKIKEQRSRLINQIKEKSFNQVMEEAAYTWFNRFIALRFMEVNDYLPTGVRVLSSLETDKKDPDILTHALSVNLPLDKEEIYRLMDAGKTEELYKYLVITQCNALHELLPSMFEPIADYTELLFPENLLFTDSVIREMVAEIPEEDWREVEIIGWMYQYYMSEKKDEVIQAKKKYITAEIPAVTQLFTPAWIVQYMVDNSLGRLWQEAHANPDLKSQWQFYLEHADLDPDIQFKLESYINKNINPEEIKFLDPACGSGHILVYAFELLYQIYKISGYSEKDIPKLILEKNLYGLDIDDRAVQLATFALIMKARQKNRQILWKAINLNICAIQESNGISEDTIRLIAGRNNVAHYDKIKKFIENFRDAKTLGSIIKTGDYDKGLHEDVLERINSIATENLFDNAEIIHVSKIIETLFKQAEIMARKYDIVVTNPPYMGSKYMNAKLASYIENEYPEVKSDLFSVFVMLCMNMTKPNGYLGFVTPFVWMFIKSYEGLREYIVKNKTISSLIQLEYNAYEAAMVPACTFTLRNYYVDVPGEYIKLSAFTGSENQPIKIIEAIKDRDVEYRYSCHSNKFNNIPGYPIAYWISNKIIEIFSGTKYLGNKYPAKVGQNTGDNERFLRLWYEINLLSIGFYFKSSQEALLSELKWFPYNKGGEFRKWYGNNDYVINWENDGKEIKEYAVIRNKGKHWSRYIQNLKYIFQESITYSFISSSNFGVRYSPQGFIFDVGGSSLFPSDKDRYYILAFLCSKLAFNFLGILNPTLNFQVGNVSKIPLIYTKDNEFKGLIENLSKTDIRISKADWDSFETSWDFEEQPLLSHRNGSDTIEQAFANWQSFAQAQFDQLHRNEEEINRIFIDIYGLQDEMTPEVEEKDITIRKADLERDIKSFISYSVGCMIGRYSLDVKGLAYAGGEFDQGKYQTFTVDRDAIIPILSEEYFEDDIVSRFVDFVKTVFGEKTLSQNLNFIAGALGQAAGESATDRIRKYFVNDFYKDHVQTYKKRPIYWLFTSGRQKAFNALIYMHRYHKGMVAKVRTDYLHELQGKHELERRRLEQVAASSSNQRDKRAAEKRLNELSKQKEELRKYDELLRHTADQQIEIDLDDGVKVNYAKFEGLLAKIL